jgi:hypothetical protein
MARFTTTIELHGASEQDYKTLHTELQKRSFVVINSNVTKANSISTRKDEFNREGNISIQDVTDAVLRAAGKTGKKYSFTIIRNKPAYN